MMCMGLATHFLVDLARMMKESEDLRLSNYLFGSTKNRIATSLSTIGAVVGYVALDQMNELTAITAFGAGYMANTVPDVLGKRTGKKLG